jgi:hypothetical protein
VTSPASRSSNCGNHREAVELGADPILGSGGRVLRAVAVTIIAGQVNPVTATDLLVPNGVQGKRWNGRRRILATMLRWYLSRSDIPDRRQRGCFQLN